jgi:hypothetical protein
MVRADAAIIDLSSGSGAIYKHKKSLLEMGVFNPLIIYVYRANIDTHFWQLFFKNNANTVGDKVWMPYRERDSQE